MEIQHDNSEFNAGIRPPSCFGGQPTQWAGFVLGLAGGFALVYVTVARPNADSLAEVQERLSRVETALEKVADTAPSAHKAADLLAALASQQQSATAAAAALERVNELCQRIDEQGPRINDSQAIVARLEQLQSQLAAHAPRTTAASEALRHVAALEERLIRQRGMTDESESALAALERLRATALDMQEGAAAAESSLNRIAALNDRLIAEDEPTRAAQATVNALSSLVCDVVAGQASVDDVRRVVAQWTSLHDELAQRADNVADVEHTSRALLALEGQLAADHSTGAAQEALDQLVALRDRVDAEAGDVEEAQRSLDGLVTLKQRTIAGAVNLAEVIETVELAADVQAQLEAVRGTLGQLRQWTTELLMLEPALQRAMRSLEPLGQLSDLRRLAPAQVRAAARALLDRQSADGAPVEDSAVATTAAQ